MSLTTTRAPSAARASACVRPRPPPAPVTMTTRSSQIPMRLLSQVRLAAVGHQRGSGDVARIVTQQEGNDPADIVLEVADASERNAADECLELGRRELRPHLEAWRHAVGNDGVDPHPVRAPFDRCRSRQGADHLLGPGIERKAGGVRAQGRSRAEVDHAALAGDERRVRCLHAPQRAEEAAVPGAPRVLLGDLEHRPEADHHRVVDQAVEPPEALDRRRDTGVDLVAASYVALHGQRLDTASTHLVSRLLHLVQGPAGGDDARALSRGRERDPLADPLPRAGDQHDLAVQPTHRGLQTAWGYLTRRQVIVCRVDLRYSSEELAFRDELREWLSRTLPTLPPKPPADDWPARRAYDTAWQRLLYDAGYAGINWPTEVGGRGASPTEHLLFLEESERAGAPYVGVNFVGLLHAGPTLIAEGNDEQRVRHLPPILRGDEVWCQGFSEPGAGSDLASMRTRAVRDGDHYVVSGHKIWTSYASVADWCELLVRTDN